MKNDKFILIVDDEVDNAELLSLVLKSEGYRVRTAANGKEALDILASSERPTLILLDIRMPILDGIQFLEILRKDSAFDSIAVIVATAQADVLEVKGANAFLEKPFGLNTLLEEVEKYFK